MVKNAAKNLDTNVYTQNMGRNAIELWERDFTKWLNKKDQSSYTGHTWRRTGATILADQGSGEVALKQVDHWKSMITVMLYVNNSIIELQSQQNFLSIELNRPIQKLKNLTETPLKKGKPPSEVVTNTKPFNSPNNDVKVIENFKGDNSIINMTTNIIITTAIPSEMVGYLIAIGSIAQNKDEKNTDT